jgi:hypothetical protein
VAREAVWLAKPWGTLVKSSGRLTWVGDLLMNHVICNVKPIYIEAKRTQQEPSRHTRNLRTR